MPPRRNPAHKKGGARKQTGRETDAEKSVFVAQGTRCPRGPGQRQPCRSWLRKLAQGKETLLCPGLSWHALKRERGPETWSRSTSAQRRH